MAYRKMIQKIFGLWLATCLCVQFCFSQKVQTSVDRQDILIGEQFKYNVKATFPSGGLNVHWFTIPDSIGHFEVVDRSKIDTATTDNNITLSQTITYTSFDSGRWNTPALLINLDPKVDDTTVNLFTDSVAINVGYSPSDSTNQLRDIKTIMEVQVTDYFWYYIIGGVILLLIIAYFLWRYFKNRKKAPVTEFAGKISPYDEAIQALEKLKQLNLQSPDDIKQYHERLSQIFKWFITRKQKTSVMNKTTGDVLILLSENNLPAAIIANTASALRIGDAAKFAKYLPTRIESEECMDNIKNVITFIANPKPANT